MLEPLIDEELKLLERVKAGLDALSPTRVPAEAPILRELDRIRDVMLSGEEVKDQASLREQWHHQSALLQQLRDARSAEVVDPGSPYFGHLRLREGDREWDLCLGRATCVERGVRIVDWRDAPISKLFYAYRQGEEYDEEIAERERIGEILVRRMVRIQGGVLQRIQAPEGDFALAADASQGWRKLASTEPQLSGGEATAMRAHSPGEGADRRLGSDDEGLSRPADKRLPEITGLIDPEQFQLITRRSSGVLVVRGAAGSGKTTVALHRVAYLSFDDPKIDGPDTLVAVFSPALRSYVGHVLPSLGLNSVAIVTYLDWVRDQRRRHFSSLPSRVREDSPGIVQRIKLSPLIGSALQAQVQRVAGPSKWRQAFDDWASVLTQLPLLREHRDRIAPEAFSDSELERFVDFNRRAVDRVHAHLQGERGAEAELDPEDDALLLRAWQLRVGPIRGQDGRPLRYRHVVLDEVQEFSPVEVQILIDCLDPQASITLAGDTQQHMDQHGGFTSWSAFFDQLGMEMAAVETLRISYRSSNEIIRFAFSVLGDLAEEEGPPPSPRSGPPVELFRFGDRGACVFFLAEALRRLGEAEPLASVAILTPSPEASATYYAALEKSELPRLRLVEDQNFTFQAGIEVTELEQVKGLEFDYVILVDVEREHYPDDPSARRRLHVGATRAVHQLWLTAVGTPSPLVVNLDRAAGVSETL